MMVPRTFNYNEESEESTTIMSKQLDPTRSSVL